MSQKLVIDACSYFFEVLVKQFLELEMSVHKKSGLFSIFKKIDYSERAGDYKDLQILAIEARDLLPSGELLKDNATTYTLNAKLIECYSIYINMVGVQNSINLSLHQKAQGENYNWNEYNLQLKHFDMLRDSLEFELPKLQSLYAAILTKQPDEVSKEN